MTPARRRALHRASRHVSIFYAFEVILVVVPLLSITMGTFSSQLLTRDVFPYCKQLDAHYGTGDTCLRIDVVAGPGYWVAVAAVVLYLLSGVDGSPTHKFIHNQLHPHDAPPPTLCGGCRRRVKPSADTTTTRPLVE